MTETSFPLSTYFFGCRPSGPGHYLAGPRLRSLHDRREAWKWHDRMTALDGALAPDQRPQVEAIAWAWRLTGFTPVPYSALSWWDRTVDKRGGSNVIIFAPGHTVTAEGILELARRDYPGLKSVERDITIEPDWRERTWAPRISP